MENKTIVITGITGGVGESLARAFLRKGWLVIGLGRTAQKLTILKKKLNYDALSLIKVDIRNSFDVGGAFKTIDGSIDVLVNNAAIFKMKTFYECTTENIDNILDTNLKGAMFCTRQALRKMKKGRIINIGSVSGTHGIKNQAIYSASKYGLIGFAESLAQEHKDILFTTINPGGIDTPLWNESNPYSGDVSKLLKPIDISSAVEYVVNLPDNVVLKTMTIFPNNEWH